MTCDECGEEHGPPPCPVDLTRRRLRREEVTPAGPVRFPAAHNPQCECPQCIERIWLFYRIMLRTRQVIEGK